MSFNIDNALKYALSILKSQRPQLESEILLSHVLGVPRSYLHAHGDKNLSNEEFELFSSLIERASKHEPIEYITQKASFYEWEFEITHGVLIPRPETEILVDRCDELIKKKKIRHVFELGVGSGVISISLALLNPWIFVIASDINPQALKLTKKNIEKFSHIDSTLQDRILLVGENVLEKEDFFLAHNIELFISNPPYISNHYSLPKNVSYEPREALFGGEVGDEILRGIIAKAKKYHIPYLACEMGWDQKESMSEALGDFYHAEFYKDLSHLDRGFVGSMQHLILKD